MTTFQLGGFSGPRLPEPARRVCDTVLARAGQHPGRPAVICGDDVLTYGELAEEASEIARRLTADSRYSGARRVGVQSHRTAGAVTHALGISLSGRSYVFLDPQAPPHTTDHIISTAGLSVTADPRTGELHTRPGHHTPPPIPRPRQRRTKAGLDDEAYVLFTSGSSGRPKGVFVSQRNLASSNDARLAAYEDFGAPIFLLISPFHFDSSVAGVWGTLTAGGTLVIADEEERRIPRALLRLIARHGVTHTLTVPSFYAELLHTVGEDERNTGLLTSLRLVVSAGEALPGNVIERHFSLLPGVVLSNEYGPTECTVWSTYRRYEKPEDSSIGFPVPGTTVHLLDERLREVPNGEVGQIAVSGGGVAGGYLGDERATSARFIDTADDSGRPMKTYLTGDLGRWSDESGLAFVGRLDNEVKIRGVRVHIETIEEALAAHPAVQAAAVAYDAGSATSYAFAVKAPGAGLDAGGIRRFLEETLGAAVVPDRIVFTGTLPRTGHDKIDRDALLASVRRATRNTASRDDDSAMVERVARVWEEVLGVTVRPSEGVTFFELGGNSLTVLRLSRALGKLIGRPVGVKSVYRCGTIHEQVDLLSRV